MFLIIHGGIVGMNDKGNIQDCLNSIVINAKSANYLGGVCGFSDGGSIEGCINLETIIGNANVGGIVGSIKGGGTLQNCYNSKNVTAMNITAGGLVGFLQSNSNVLNSYNVGVVQSPTYSGAIVGANGNTIGVSPGIVNNCYYLDNMSSEIGINVGSANITNTQKLDEDTLKTYATTLGIAYTEDKTNLNDGFPILKWQLEPPQS